MQGLRWGSLLDGRDGGQHGGMQHKSDTELCKLPIRAYRCRFLSAGATNPRTVSPGGSFS